MFSRKLAIIILSSLMLVTSSLCSPAHAKTKTCSEDLILRYGQSCKYKSVTFTVNKPKRFNPGDSGLWSGRYKYTFLVKVVNGGSKIVKFDSIIVQASSSAGDGDKAFDSANNISGEPDSALLPHRTVKFVEGFGFSSSRDITVQVNVDPFHTYSGPTVYWTK